MRRLRPPPRTPCVERFPLDERLGALNADREASISPPYPRGRGTLLAA
jgi:hypothetical protein